MPHLLREIVPLTLLVHIASVMKKVYRNIGSVKSDVSFRMTQLKAQVLRCRTFRANQQPLVSAWLII